MIRVSPELLKTLQAYLISNAIVFYSQNARIAPHESPSKMKAIIPHTKNRKGINTERISALDSYFKCINSPMMKKALATLIKMNSKFNNSLGQPSGQVTAIATSAIVTMPMIKVAFQTAFFWLWYDASSNVCAMIVGCKDYIR